MGGLLGVYWGSEVLEGPKQIGEDPQGSIGGLLGVWRGSEVLEVDWRGSTGVYWGSAGGLRSWKDQRSESDRTHMGLLGV